ncbi:MAG: hypothetical protein GY913_31575 [Proteobacteria bacterium]|nr:hypothetical protein [Pseudomonadota bacterium]MCP4921461.1 hypothetical protein [Pseudomonadota bacterium]
MGLLDDLIKAIGTSEVGKKAAGVAAEKAAEASAAAAEAALDDFADDFEKHLVGDLDEVNDKERELELKARKAQSDSAAYHRQVHEERMSREDRAKAELEALKKKMGK